ncbi:hypothetical protein AB6A40_000850 [Gnathostoma spinigerum]|uniref:Uncharacterized protein n=1 Tax=Gnathostoma spinigerum TaxID=75299 RepID=A0ABD6E9R4_9BILA
MVTFETNLSPNTYLRLPRIDHRKTTDSMRKRDSQLFTSRTLALLGSKYVHKEHNVFRESSLVRSVHTPTLCALHCCFLQRTAVHMRLRNCTVQNICPKSVILQSDTTATKIV